MLTSTALLDSFRRDRARGVNDDIDLTLRPAYLDLLTKLGDPHTKLPPVFHVAGTNGKGSVCAFLRSMLEAAGKRVHVYTSPHLVRFHERIRIAGELISDAELVEILQLCRNYAPEGVTYFEAATAAAFTAFARYPADFTIVEVGLGGRLDATNIIPRPLASIITRISYDHRDYLGETLEAIACEKAGIMRHGVPCFTAEQPDDGVLAVLRKAAAKLQTALSVGGKDWRVAKTANGFHYGDKEHAFDLPRPALLGEHQRQNAGLAIAAVMMVPGIQQAIAQGMRSVEWPGRLQKITHGCLADLLPESCELWLDGGHNDSAGEALARQAEAWKDSDARPLHLICGMLTTKRPAEFLAPLSLHVTSLQTIAIPHEPASLTAEDMALIGRRVGITNVATAADVVTAINNLTQRPTEPQRILICGSLYLAGEVLTQNGA
jgi:dihydrofolate synthase/folylpolyglutamate synthase